MGGWVAGCGGLTRGRVKLGELVRVSVFEQLG